MISLSPKSFGVKTAATPLSRSAARVGVRDDPADDDRHVAGACLPQPGQHLRHQLHVRARQDGDADAVDVLGDRGARRSAPGVSRMPW